MTQDNTDRYVSFQGIDCDARARRLLRYIEHYIETPPHRSPWLDYFQAKLGDRASLGQDELNFVGSQINNIRSLFEEYEDADALHLLEQIEQECC